MEYLKVKEFIDGQCVFYRDMKADKDRQSSPFSALSSAQSLLVTSRHHNPCSTQSMNGLDELESLYNFAREKLTEVNMDVVLNALVIGIQHAEQIPHEVKIKEISMIQMECSFDFRPSMVAP